MGDEDEIEWDDLRNLVGKPLIYVGDTERNAGDPADLRLDRAFGGQDLITAALETDPVDRCND